MTAVFKQAFPNPGDYNIDDNGDGARTNLQALRYMKMFAGEPVPGFDVTNGYDGSGRLSTRVYLEQTAHAAADTPTRSGSQRMAMRMTYTYNASSQLTKIRGEVSGDSGSTYADWDDLAGNSFYNYSYNANGTLNTETWSTT